MRGNRQIRIRFEQIVVGHKGDKQESMVDLRGDPVDQPNQAN
jgi:hypothetical protein